ncbi:MAG: 2-polyprenyl-3-methyl-6-methoxy-1,4-benzoquinone monooxygenase [Gammaproteobacteria bacterium]|nr:2-polyprenyl-3-methyl-6-methoxy-1,4-benzoquinone monooxygenase [Gammaproteobacteria bacterium]
MANPFEKKVTEIIGLVDQGFKTLSGQHGKQSTFPEQPVAPELTDVEKKQSGSLMRVNHVGEVCAQALYLGQALSARSDETRAKLLKAAEEEREHLGWCEQRLDELGENTSVLSPLFFIASAGLGAVTGFLGDRISLGFVEATEDQVVEHIDRHLEKMPSQDSRSQEMLESIRADERRHGESAIDAGGVPYPDAIRQIMTLASKVMTETTKHI